MKLWSAAATHAMWRIAGWEVLGLAVIFVVIRIILAVVKRRRMTP